MAWDLSCTTHFQAGGEGACQLSPVLRDSSAQMHSWTKQMASFWHAFIESIDVYLLASG